MSQQAFFITHNFSLIFAAVASDFQIVFCCAALVFFSDFNALMLYLPRKTLF